MDEDDVARVANEQITARFQRIGIWEQTPEGVENTRANFRIINDIREARERQRNAIRRSLREMVTSAMGQGLWVILFGIAALLGRLFWQAVQK